MKKNNKKYALKEMSKVRIIDRHSERSIKGERDFLSVLLHPFIVNMVCSFQDYENLYLVMDLLTGGDLRYHLCKIRHFSEEETKFFIACLLLGLEYIHGNNIIHRDIKPENLVSDENGYIRITDFGVAKIRKEDNSSETSGTPGYMAPEVLMAQNHSFPVDFFAIGIMGYEFMIGERPYLGKTRKEIKQLVLKKQAKIERDEIPDGWSLESVDFINKCMKRKESRRLGYRNGISELKNHLWFKDFDWDSLFNKTMPAPFVPKKAGNYDKKYCELIEKISDTTLDRYQNYLNQKNFRHVFDGYTCINYELLQKTINDTISNNDPTRSRSNKLLGKTNSSTKTDILNKLISNTNELSNRTNKKLIKNREKEFSNGKNSDKEKIDILNKLNYHSFLENEKDNEKERKPNLKDIQKVKDDNHNLSLQKFLNYSKKKRIKFGGLNKNFLKQEEKEKEGEQSQREKGKKFSNLSDLDPSIINNFKKINAGFEEKTKKLRSSSVCYSSNNDHNNKNNYKSNKIKNKAEAEKTLEVNKINRLYNLMNLNHKGSLTGKKIDKKNSPKIDFNENFSPFKTPLGSPKNANRGNLILENELNNFNIGFKTNRREQLYLPNLLKERTLSPRLKIKKKMNINIELLQNIQMKLKAKREKNSKEINFKKMNKNNNKVARTGMIGLKKRMDSANIFNKFIYNNKKMRNRGFSAQRNKNVSENKSNNLGDNDNKNMYGTIQTKKIKHNFSALNI